MRISLRIQFSRDVQRLLRLFVALERFLGCLVSARLVQLMHIDDYLDRNVIAFCPIHYLLLGR